LVEFQTKIPHPDWKVSSEEKKEGLTIWQRTTPQGINAVKA
jgi:hypothetical protein